MSRCSWEMRPAAGGAGARAGRGAAWQADTPSRSTSAKAPFMSVLDDRRVFVALTGDICIVGELFLAPQLETAIQILDQIRPGRCEIVPFSWIVHLIVQKVSSIEFV